jgi:hypothetical protein
MLIPEINILVSSAHNSGLELIFVPNGKLLMFIKINWGSRIEQWGTPLFIIALFEKKFTKFIMPCYNSSNIVQNGGPTISHSTTCVAAKV